MDSAKQCTQDCWSSSSFMLQMQKVKRGPGFMCMDGCFTTEASCMAKCEPADHDCDQSCMDSAKQCTQDCWSSSSSMLQTQKVKRGPGFMCMDGCFTTEASCMAKCEP